MKARLTPGGGLRRTALRGIYLVPDLTDEWTPLVLATAPSALLAVSGQVAAAIYGWDGFDRLAASIRAKPDLVTPWTRRPSLVPYRQLGLRPEDLRVVDGIRVAPPMWTLGEISQIKGLKSDRLEQAVECALRRKHVTEDELWAWAAAHPEGALLAEVLALRGRGTPPTGSLLETLALQRVLRFHAIEVVGRQVDVFENGEFVCRQDFLLDGWTFFEVDGSQHDRPSHRDSDRKRDLKLKGYGLEVARASRQEVAEDGILAARLRRVVQQGCKAHVGEPVPLDHNTIHVG